MLEEIKKIYKEIAIQKHLEKDAKEKNALAAITPLSDANITNKDLISIGDARIKEIGLIYHNIQSFNNFVEIGIKQIITEIFKIDKDFDVLADSDIERINVKVKFTDVVISPPKYRDYDSSLDHELLPITALVNNITYSGEVNISADITATAYMRDGTISTKYGEIKDRKICNIPVMVHSNICNLKNKSKEALSNLHEDPNDSGGYFIIKGVEWVIDSVENIAFNQPRIFRNKFQKEVTRCEFISKPGDDYQNSDQIIIRLMVDGRLTVDVHRDSLMNYEIPFYIIFRALGWTTDEKILKNINYCGANTKDKFNDTDSLEKIIDKALEKAIKVPYPDFANARKVTDQISALKFIAETLATEKNKPLEYLLPLNNVNMQKAIYIIERSLDIHFLPHIGTTKLDRDNKLKYLAQLIKKVYVVNKKIIKSTDRDSLKNKRIIPSGMSYAKNFKTYFHMSVITNIIKKLRSDLKTRSFKNIDLHNSLAFLHTSDDFNTLITQTITSGNKSQLKVSRHRSITNRLTTQQLNRKSNLNVQNILRQITAPNMETSKASSRSTDMRQVHPSYTGYICAVNTPEGAKVGINKQLAIFSNICGNTSSMMVRKLIQSYAVKIDCDNKEAKLLGAARDDIFLIDNISYIDRYNHDLQPIFVNGYPIGYAKYPILVAKKFREIRRRPGVELDAFVTIHYDPEHDELNFWTDAGRLTRPLIIVYNNINNPELFGEVKGFVQSTLLSADIIKGVKSGAIKIQDLLENGIIEFISAEEQENTYIAATIEQLVEDRVNRLKRYTHCDIAQSLFGPGALTSPFANHNQTPRVTFQGNQAKQTCGYYAGNWPYRFDKEAFLQYACEYPLVQTLSNKYIPPNGINCTVAIAAYGGYNQEDSIIINQGGLDRGAFAGSKFTFYYSEIEDPMNESFGATDPRDTIRIKDGRYCLLDKNGFIKKNEIVRKGDVLIGKYLKLPDGDSTGFLYQDKSIIYKDNENAIVYSVVAGQNYEGRSFVKVGLRKIRNVDIGDKFCLTPDYDVLTCEGWKKINALTQNDRIATLTHNHVLEYNYVNELYEYDIDEYILSVDNAHISLACTLNHKLYVQRNGNYERITASNIIGKSCNWKKDCINQYGGHYEVYNLRIDEHNYKSCLFYDWIVLYGIYYYCGVASRDGKTVVFNNVSENTKKTLLYAAHALDVEYKSYKDKIQIIDFAIWIDLYPINKRKYHMPSWILNLTQSQCKILLQYMLCGKLIELEGKYVIRSGGWRDTIHTLAIHAGYNCTYNASYITILCAQHKLNPIITLPRRLRLYRGKVYCPNVKNNVFMVRRRGKAYWIGNSSRAGQKGVIGMSYNDADMMVTDKGEMPLIIINSHSIPSRMTLGQLIEPLVAQLAIKKYKYMDGTVFSKDNDVEKIMKELKELGFNYTGKRKMINGTTGEFMDTEIYVGQVYYQRLQKFVADQVYAVARGPTDAITQQPLDGKARSGGQRLGEMERDVICAHGTMRFLNEKLANHSDGAYVYICVKCGNFALAVNYKKKIIECKVCRAADIRIVAATWSAKLMLHELQSSHIGTKFIMAPPIFEE